MNIDTVRDGHVETDGVSFEIDISKNGDLPVDCLVVATGLSKTQIKDAMTKGAVWLSRPILQHAPKPPPLNEQASDDADPWAKAWSKSKLSTDVEQTPKPMQAYTGSFTKPKRLRRGKKGLSVGDRKSVV